MSECTSTCETRRNKSPGMHRYSQPEHAASGSPSDQSRLHLSSILWGVGLDVNAGLGATLTTNVHEFPRYSPQKVAADRLALLSSHSR